MAKFYTDKAPTPVFAVTFVSNREGIIPKTAIGKTGNTATNSTISNIEILNSKKAKIKEYEDDLAKLTSYAGGLITKDTLQKYYDQADYKRTYETQTVANAITYVKTLISKATNDLPNAETLSDAEKALTDSEYLIYSNLQIQNLDDGKDLSQQSNWYLREAEVELTRDWPIQKAKLIVTCKLLDNGSIPPLVEVENGFVWTKNKDAFVKLLPEGRFLSADDEVRIYAGYKNDQCISMNDLDKYPFDFTNLEVTGNIPADSQDGLKLQQLQAEKKAIEDAINALKNPLTDPLTVYYSILGVAALVAGGVYLYGIAAPAATVIPAAATTTTGTAVGTTAATVPLGLPVPARILAQQAAARTANTAAGGTPVTVGNTTINVSLPSNTITTPTVTVQSLTTGARVQNALGGTNVTAVKPGQVSNINNPSVTTTVNTAVNTATKSQLATEGSQFLNLAKSAGSDSGKLFQTISSYQKTLSASQSTTFSQTFNGNVGPKGALGAFALAVQAVVATGANAEELSTSSSTATRQASEPFKAKLRDYLDGRRSFDDNKELFRLLGEELVSVNNLIQILQKKAGVKTKTYKSDPNKIAPIFWGFIDSVDFISNSNAGVQIIYNLRDRSRILADTKLVTLPFLGTDASNKNTFEGLKHKTIESVYRATNGGIYLDNSYTSASSLAWRSGFEKGETINLYEDKDKKITDTKSALASERLKFTAAIEDPARWVLANSFLSSSDIKKTDYNNFDPLFHTWTLQGPLVTGSGNTTMQIINKSPFEILSYLAMTEVMPIDIFTSHINGHFMFAPRILDTSGLYDEQRGNRLYYFFDCFDKLPEQRSLIKDIRVMTSTIGVYNRFTVLTADFGSSINASLSGLTSIVDIASANTKNRKVPVKQHVIVDPKVKSDATNPQGAAQALALTTASSMARDHTNIIFKVIGDSSFYPGEAVRVFNTVLHSKGVFTFNATSTSSAVFLKSLYNEVEKLKVKAVEQGSGATKKVVDLSAVIDSMRKVAGQDSDDLNQALPMYKVRAITHSLKANGNDAGYTTKIVAVADIL